ncbi:hypothetical protein ACU4GI_10810 [Cupriavidus basilensis]
MLTTNIKENRRRLGEDIAARLHAINMRKRKNVSEVSWDVAWWAERKLNENLPFALDSLGGLMGEW